MAKREDLSLIHIFTVQLFALLAAQLSSRRTKEETSIDVYKRQVMNESDKTYYYASAGGKATGTVSKQELRKLLEQHIIHESANVIRKGDAQWRRLSAVSYTHLDVYKRTLTS